MPQMVQFNWHNVNWTVKWVNGEVKYRDTAHLGGPWSSVVDTVKNPSIDLTFRKMLVTAERELLTPKGWDKI